MLPLILILTILTSSAIGQGLAGLPTCAQNCIGSGIPSECSTTDIACICKDSAYQAQSSCCIFSQCSGQDIQKAIAFAIQICAAAQVTIATTAPASCASTAAATLATAPGSSLGSSLSTTPTTMSQVNAMASASASSQNDGAKFSPIRQDTLAGFLVLALGVLF